MPEDIQKLKDQNAYIEQVLNKDVREQLLNIDGVVHVSIGLKEKGVLVTDILCIRVYVKEKKDEKELHKKDIIPSQINGVPTDVNEIGLFNFSNDNAKYDVLVGGITVTNRIIALNSAGTGTQMNRGTLGCLATHKPSNSTVILSNWHVLTANGANNGERIYQPGPTTLPPLSAGDLPYRPKDDVDAIGKLLDSVISTKVDGAIASLDGCNSICCRCCGRNYKNEINGLSVGGNPPKNTIVGEASATNGETVYKVGRSTGRTTGRVVDNNYPSFQITIGGVNHTFNGQIYIEKTNKTIPFSAHGDSGSVIINQQNNIIGLLFASGRTTVGSNPSTYFSIANHIADVKAALNIDINLTPSSSANTLLAAPVVTTSFGSENSATWDQLKNKLMSDAKGKQFVELIDKHQNEIIYLVNHNREVTVCWHRNKGPAFLAAILNMLNDEETELPKTISGKTLADLLSRMKSVLKKHAKANLRRDLDDYADELMWCVNESNTKEQLVQNIMDNLFSTSQTKNSKNKPVYK